MKDVKVTIGATTIKSLHYDHNFNAKAGEAIKMSVNTRVSVNLNPEVPTVAMVAVKHTVADEENKIMKMEIETITPVSVSTFVDNLDDVITARSGEIRNRTQRRHCNHCSELR